jgi:hypothetical protein
MREKSQEPLLNTCQRNELSAKMRKAMRRADWGWGADRIRSLVSDMDLEMSIGHPNGIVK